MHSHTTHLVFKVAVVAAAVLSLAAAARAQVVGYTGFESSPAGTSLAVPASGGIDGLAVSIDPLPLPGGGMTANFVRFETRTAVGPTLGDFDQELNVNNALVSLDPGVAYDRVEVDYAYFGGSTALSVNGSTFTGGSPADILGGSSGTLAGADFILDGTPDEARLTFSGNVSGFAIGGQELFIDRVVFTAVPEPASLAVLGLAGLGLVRRRG